MHPPGGGMVICGACTPQKMLTVLHTQPMLLCKQLSFMQSGLSGFYRYTRREKIPMRFSSRYDKRTGFTLIELLVVIAIILILIAIALPNFLSAMTRAKVSRAKSDMRTVRMALESYLIDFKTYPDHATGTWHPSLLEIPQLTTPNAYLTLFPQDPFPRTGATYYSYSRYYGDKEYYRYYNTYRHERTYKQLVQQGIKWFLMSNGPDMDNDVDDTGTIARDLLNGLKYMYYAPTNGTTSSGDFINNNRKYEP
jgi:type II secretion system protein G